MLLSLCGPELLRCVRQARSQKIDIARADLMAVARLYEHSTKEEVALRLYLAMRPLLATLQRNATSAGAHSRESEMPVVRAIHG